MYKDWNRRHNGILHISDYKHQPDTFNPYTSLVDAFYFLQTKFIIYIMNSIKFNYYIPRKYFYKKENVWKFTKPSGKDVMQIGTIEDIQKFFILAKFEDEQSEKENFS